MDRHIVLIGFMGSGKTSVGKQLATELEVDLYDTDEVIGQDTGKHAGQVLDEVGDPEYRQIEYRTLQKVAARDPGIISCGGGIVDTQESRSLLAQPEFFVAWLSAPFDLLSSRVGGDKLRPIFRDVDTARKRFEGRQAWYEEVANVTIDAAGSIEQSVEDVLEALANEP